MVANAFMCSLEEKLSKSNELPSFYNRYVDDALTKQSNLDSAASFLSTLNNCHPSLSFTMEVEVEGNIPFLGMKIMKKDGRLETEVYNKPTNTGLLLHYHSHVDKRYKRSLITTMLNRAYRLSSSWSYFSKECERLKMLFNRLKYPPRLVDSTISTFIDQQYKAANQEPESSKQKVVRIALPFKDQKSDYSIAQIKFKFARISRSSYQTGGGNCPPCPPPASYAYGHNGLATTIQPLRPLDYSG